MGESTIDIPNVRPMDAPIIAMDFVLALSVVKSASNAKRTADIAPAP